WWLTTKKRTKATWKRKPKKSKKGVRIFHRDRLFSRFVPEMRGRQTTLFWSVSTTTRMEFVIEVAGPQHLTYAEEICRVIEEAAKARGTGIAKRDPEYIRKKIQEGKAVIALHGEEFAGFC